MVVGAILVAAIIVGGLILATLLGKGPESADMSPATLDSFQVTQAKEGSVIPLTFGTVRVNTNLLWYGNLRSKEVKEEVGGKGGGSEKVTVGFEYYLDIWHAICIGPNVTLLGVYIQSEARGLSALGTYYFNDGDDPYYPTEPGPYASPLRGVSHLFQDNYFLGLNATTVPTIHLIVKRTSSAAISNPNLASGVNPAAIIYDLFRLAGATHGDFDIASFNEAAVYWAGKNYGLNISFSKQDELRTQINKVFTYVDGAVSFTEENKIYLKAFRDTDPVVETITTSKFREFQFTRRSWEDVFTDFRANFIDSAQDFTERTVRVRNSAVAKLIGYDKQKTIDLTAFNDIDIASERTWELMKKLSYPEAQITCKLGMEYSGLKVGDIIEITNDDYGLLDVDFRIWEVDASQIDSNEITFRLVQSLEGLFDDNFQTGGGSQWVTPSYDPESLAYQDWFELPYNNQTGEAPAFLMLAARKGVEDGFQLLWSATGSDYTAQAVYTTFSQRGIVNVTYPITIAIDDGEDGIVFTPYRDDPQFQSNSRTNLFAAMRFALINKQELVAFQTVTAINPTQFRLTGIIRGVMNTPIVSHTAGQVIWLTSFGNNVLTGLAVNDFYVKLLPTFGGKILDAGSATQMHIIGTAKAQTPWPVSRIQVDKTGASNIVSIFPTSSLFNGAGVEAGTVQFDQWPPAFVGDIQWYTNYDGTIQTVALGLAVFTVTRAGAFTLYVRHRRSGKFSGWKSLSVGASDGTYIGPSN
jgi:hypothetical protein